MVPYFIITMIAPNLTIATVKQIFGNEINFTLRSDYDDHTSTNQNSMDLL